MIGTEDFLPANQPGTNEKNNEEAGEDMPRGNFGYEGIYNEDDRIIGRFVCGNVVNLSRKALSEEETSLLSKALKF